MKASKVTDAQKAFILEQGEDRVPVAEICRKAGISQARYLLPHSFPADAQSALSTDRLIDGRQQNASPGQLQVRS